MPRLPTRRQRLLPILRERGMSIRNANAATAAVLRVYQPGMSADQVQAAVVANTVGSPAWLALLLQLLPILLPILEKLFAK